MAEETKSNDYIKEASSTFVASVDSEVVDMDEEDDENDLEDDENREYELTFQGKMNPLDFIEDDASGFQPYQRFERIEYEALAQRKRKVLTSRQGHGSSKKYKIEDSRLTSIDEEMGNMNCGMQGKSRKLKKRGRPKGAKCKLTPEVSRKLGEANIYYAKGQFEDAIHLLKEVVILAPNLSETYHTLGLVHEEIGDKIKSMNFYMLAVLLAPKDHPFLWKRLFVLSVEQGNSGQATYCLNKAIKADPEDVSLRFHRAKIYAEHRDYQKAAELYHQVVEHHPDNVEACMLAAKMYHKCNQVEQSIRILEDYIRNHSSKDDFSAIGLLVAIHMENSAYAKAIQQIDLARSTYGSQKPLPMYLAAKAVICQLHLGSIEEADIFFNTLERECPEDAAHLIMEVAETCMCCGHNKLALKYYCKLEENTTNGNGFLHLRIARCYRSLMQKAKATTFFYKALSAMEDNIDVRTTLASLLLEEGKEDEAIAILSPPRHLESTSTTCLAQSTPWWDNGKVKKQLAQIYLAKGMLEEFVDTIFPLISETLTVEYSNRKFKPRQRIPNRTLSERVKLLDDHQDVDFVVQGFRPLAASSELLKATRARRSLQKREALKEENRTAVLAVGLEWHSDDSDDETPRTQREPPLPNLLKDVEHHQLILDLCKSLASLQRYWEAIKIIKDSQKLALNALSFEKKEELMSLEAQVAYKITESSSTHSKSRAAVQKQPKSLAAWNYYYHVRMKNKLQKRTSFLNSMMRIDPKCVPPIIISGHLFTLINQHQGAARKYLEAYKLQPDSPLINLCAGTALLNIAIGLRIRNKHQCLVQGFAFLHNNLRLCKNSQEALYNIARAYHHVGLVTLAASYYEEVLATHEENYPMPKLLEEDSNRPEVGKLAYCNLHREAAFNLHLIYKTSGAFDLARHVLKCHCTV